MNKMPSYSSLASLSEEKAALYESLQAFQSNGFFLRCSDTPEGLLVCDLPRRGGDLSGAEAALTRLGWRLLPEKKPGLWLLDRTEPAWQAMADALPATLPAFPAQEEDFAAYALCRLLLLHPAPLSRQPMELNRALWLWTVRHGSLKAFHETCAALLRQKKPLPTLGGQLLAAGLQNLKGA